MTGGRAVTVVLAALCLISCHSSGEGVLALEGAMLVDGSGGPPIPDALILVEGGHIKAVAHVGEIPVPRGARQLALNGKTVIPGLIDAHAMVERWAATRYLAWGVTTVRDFGGAGDSSFALKNDLDLVVLLGPRMFTSGPMIDNGVATPAAARKTVDLRAVAGADYLEVAGGIDPALLRALLDEVAATLKLPVVFRAGRLEAPPAPRAGAPSIEQLGEGAWALLDSGTVARAAQSLASSRAALVPTLAYYDALAHANDPSQLLRPTMRDVPAAARLVRDVARLRSRGNLGDGSANLRRARERQDQFVREFRRSGGRIAAGSGAVDALLVPGAALHDELERLVAIGFTPLEALSAATARGAQLLRADSLGRLAPGKVADLVVLNSNPVDDIAATRDIAWVMIRGQIVNPDSLRKTWH